MSSLTISYLEIDLVAFIIVAILLFARRSARTKSYDQSIFNALMVIGMILIVLDSVAWLSNGRRIENAYALNMLANCFYYFFECLIVYGWFVFVRVKITGDEKALDRRRLFYVTPALINTVFCIGSVWTGWFYSIDPVTNLYSRGDLFWLHWLICVIYLVVPTTEALIRGRRLKTLEAKRSCYFLAFFPVLPFIAVVAQALVFGLSILWPFVALSFLMIFINVQNARISTDGLTGINNRNEMDDYLDLAIRNLRPHQQLGMMIIDIDCFKSINDNYGHNIGDDALIAIADVLKRACAGTSFFLARMGGDEFTVIGEAGVAEDFADFSESLSRELVVLNNSDAFDFDIELSSGFALFDRERDTAESFKEKADAHMYEVKKEHKKAALV